MFRGLEKSGLVTNKALFLLTDSMIYSFHMPLFFFLSGLLFFKSRKSDMALIASKVDTIVYPYLLWSLLQGGVEHLLAGYVNQQSNSHSFIFKLLVSPENQFWFLYALFFCFLTALFLFRIFGKRYFFGIVFLSIIAYLTYQYLPNIFLIGILSRFFVFFFVGYVFSAYFFDKKEFFAFISQTQILASLSCIAIFCQYYYHCVLGYSFINNNFASLSLSLFMIFVVVSFCTWLSNKVESKLLINLGASSMAIFLMHVFATAGSRIFLKSVLNIYSYPIHLVIGTLAGIIFPLFMMKIFDKFDLRFYMHAPVSKWLFKAD